MAEGRKIHAEMRQWQLRLDLAGMRDEKSLAELPDEERAALQEFWDAVESLAKKGGGGS